ncbi:hypothetical protein Thimo_2561 [Thioflavicoccus mobilis 8321]|uniref:Uncharacterized protein n=1 Tax=Thioflavicoccus mobilis 8321 TaxID=765912 RepID=L0H0X1_9GAMM|nr:hypothetical protein [Thioflavicoccus mobilis]AGA91285.1 hypothetical protein Thimo_2561 [Thioflavicoccus mobilis 8321]
MRVLPILFLLFCASAAWARIPATQVMTLYQFDGPRTIPYYAVDSFARRGPAEPAGRLAQGSAVIPCLVIRGGRPLTDGKGTPYVGFEVVMDAATATPADTERFRRAVAARRDLRVANHHCDASVRYVLDVRKLYALGKPPFFVSPGASGGAPTAPAQGELDRIVRTFHQSRQCERVGRALIGRRAALDRAWDAFSEAQRGRWSSASLTHARQLDYAMRTALFEGHLDRGCSAYGACERNVVVLSIRNRARGSCLAHQACRYPGDFQGVASTVSQYNIWDEYLTQVSGLTSCFLREDLGRGNDPHADLFWRLQAMYTQNVGDAERILFGSDEDLRRLFPGVAFGELTSMRHYYHPPAMGKCFPGYDRVEYMSGAVARNGGDFALIANTRIQAGAKVGDGYRFREFLFEPRGNRDQVTIRDNYPGFIVDGRKVDLRASRGCTPYGTPRGCRFGEVGRYRRTPSWLADGRPLALSCRIADRGADCRGGGRTTEVQVGGVCDVEMQPVAGVR